MKESCYCSVNRDKERSLAGYAFKLKIALKNYLYTESWLKALKLLVENVTLSFLHELHDSV